MKSTVEPMNRYLISSHHVHKKRYNSVELIVFLRVGLVFCFNVANYIVNSVGRKTGRKLWEKKCMAQQVEQKCMQILFYAFKSTYNESIVVWQNRKFATKYHIQRQFAKIWSKKSGKNQQNPILFSFQQYFPIFLVLHESLIRCYLLKLSSYYTKCIFSTFFVSIYINRHQNLLPNALEFPLTKLKLHLSVTTNTQRFASFFSCRHKIKFHVAMQNQYILRLLHFIYELIHFFGNRWSIFTHIIRFFCSSELISLEIHFDGISQYVLGAISLYQYN